MFSRFRRKDASSIEVPSEHPADRSTAFITGDPTADRRSLQVLLDTLAEVASQPDFESLLVHLVDKSLEVTQSERGILLLEDAGAEGSQRFRVKAARGPGGVDLPSDLHYSTSVVQKVISTGDPVASVVHSSKEALDLGKSAYDLKLRAVMCVPLTFHGRFLGAVYVDSQAQRKEFTARDLTFFAALAQQLSISLETARLHDQAIEGARIAQEMEIARSIQSQLMTEIRDLPPGLDVQRWYEPCELASGDAYDVFPDDKGKLHLMIGDATGHGMGPALLAHSVQAALRSYLEVLDDPREVVRRMNERLDENMDAGTFMSLFQSTIQEAPASEEEEGADPRRHFQLDYVNAGHGCAYIVRSEGVKVLDNTGPALGMMGGVPFDLGPREILGAGDLLVLTSDGVVEARNSSRDMLGEGALFEILAAKHGMGCQAVLDGIRNRLQDHLGEEPLEDDVMILVLSVQES